MNTDIFKRYVAGYAKKLNSKVDIGGFIVKSFDLIENHSLLRDYAKFKELFYILVLHVKKIEVVDNRTLTVAFFAVSYLLDPLDFYNDFLPVIGFFDDLLLLTICYKLLESKLRLFDFDKVNSGVLELESLVLDVSVLSDVIDDIESVSLPACQVKNSPALVKGYQYETLDFVKYDLRVLTYLIYVMLEDSESKVLKERDVLGRLLYVDKGVKELVTKVLQNFSMYFNDFFISDVQIICSFSKGAYHYEYESLKDVRLNVFESDVSSHKIIDKKNITEVYLKKSGRLELLDLHELLYYIERFDTAKDGLFVLTVGFYVDDRFVMSLVIDVNKKQVTFKDLSPDKYYFYSDLKQMFEKKL